MYNVIYQAVKTFVRELVYETPQNFVGRQEPVHLTAAPAAATTADVTTTGSKINRWKVVAMVMSAALICVVADLSWAIIRESTNNHEKSGITRSSLITETTTTTTESTITTTTSTTIDRKTTEI